MQFDQGQVVREVELVCVSQQLLFESLKVEPFQTAATTLFSHQLFQPLRTQLTIFGVGQLDSPVSEQQHHVVRFELDNALSITSFGQQTQCRIRAAQGYDCSVGPKQEWCRMACTHTTESPARCVVGGVNSRAEISPLIRYLMQPLAETSRNAGGDSNSAR